MTMPDRDSLWDKFDQIQDFPFPQGALSELKKYVKSLHEFLPHITDQEIIRLQAKIKAEFDPVAIGEMESKIERISEDGSLFLPHLVWGGILVSTCAAYEFGVEQVLKHWQTETSYETKFPDPSCKSKSFLTLAEHYSEKHIGIPLLPSTNHKRILCHLKGLRNSYVHKGSRVQTLPADLKQSIEKQEHVGVSLSIVDECWIASARSVAFFLFHAEYAVKDFSEAALNKCLEKPKK